MKRRLPLAGQDGWVCLDPPQDPDLYRSAYYTGFALGMASKLRHQFSFWDPETAAQRRIEWLCQPGEQA